MPLKTIVKVGSITNLSDARYCAGMGVEMLGFNAVEGTDTFVNLKNYQDIRSWLSGPLFVAEVYNFNTVSLPGILENYIPDFLELNLEDLSRLPNNVVTPVLLSVEEESFEKYRKLINQWRSRISYLILKPNNKIISAQIAGEFSTLISLSRAEDVQKLLDESKAKGIVLNGTAEIKPGLKTYDHLSEILEQLEAD